MKQERIDPARLVALDRYGADVPLRIDLAYTKPEAFCGAVYRPEARLWLYDDLARIVVRAAQMAGERYGLRLVAYDGLRTVAAQKAMLESPAVRANPQWLDRGRPIVSTPGFGGHPRGMAVDVSLETMDGVLLDMGTAFDELPLLGNGPDVNPAHRSYAGLTEAARASRAKLDDVMLGAAGELAIPLWPLSTEWWDYRFPAEIYEQYAPLDDADLPAEMRMVLSI